MARVANSRIRFLLLCIVLTFGVLLVREAWLATVRASALSSMAQSQTKTPIVLPAGRGTIFDQLGTPLALREQATTVYVDPHQVRNATREAVAAARVLGVKPLPIYRALEQRSLAFVYIARKASHDKAATLAKLNLPGFHFYAEEKRIYPQGQVAAPVLGYAGIDNVGLAGLELELNKQLTGVPGKETIVRDPFGTPIEIQSTTPAKQGSDVFLTLDHVIQANAEQVLRDTVKKWGAKDATAIVLDPKTGAVLAMATQPGYNANNYATAPAAMQSNHAVGDVFEPGSVFKVVTIAGALSEHLVTPKTAFTLPYSIRVADRVIHDAEHRGTERMTVAQILQHSSNVGAITIATKLLGEARLKHWIHQFGFGKRTGVDLPGESAGILPPYWSGSTIGNVPIGSPAAHDAARRRLGRRHRRRRRDSGLHGRGQDRYRAEAGAARLRDGPLRRDVRRHGAGERSAPGRARHGRRAARRDLRRRCRRARICADRCVRPPVPGGSARQGCPLVDATASAVVCSAGCKPSHPGVLSRGDSHRLSPLPASLGCSVFARQEQERTHGRVHTAR